MIKLNPRESKQEDLPEAANTITLVNETIAQMDLDVELADGVLTVKVVGLYLGKPVEAPFEAQKSVWKLG